MLLLTVTVQQVLAPEHNTEPSRCPLQRRLRLAILGTESPGPCSSQVASIASLAASEVLRPTALQCAQVLQLHLVRFFASALAAC